MLINIATCKIAFSQEDIDSFDLMSNGLAINLKSLISDFASSFCIWTCSRGCLI